MTHPDVLSSGMCHFGRFTAYVLATNYLMLQVLSDAGWSRKRRGDDALIVQFQIDLPHRRCAKERRRSPVGRAPERDTLSPAPRPREG
jgi:hypothetical protein